MITKENLHQMAYHNNFIPVRGCSICHEVLGYFIWHDAVTPGEIYCTFNPSCGCSSSEDRIASVEEVLDFMNSREVAK